MESRRIDAKDRIARPGESEITGDSFARQKSGSRYWSVATKRFCSKQRGRRIHKPRQGDCSENDQTLNVLTGNRGGANTTPCRPCREWQNATRDTPGPERPRLIRPQISRAGCRQTSELLPPRRSRFERADCQVFHACAIYSFNQAAGPACTDAS